MRFFYLKLPPGLEHLEAHKALERPIASLHRCWRAISRLDRFSSNTLAPGPGRHFFCACRQSVARRIFTVFREQRARSISQCFRGTILALGVSRGNNAWNKAADNGRLDVHPPRLVVRRRTWLGVSCAPVQSIANKEKSYV